MIKLTYGNTNTFYISADNGGLLIDTDYAGTLPAFYKALKQNNIRLEKIKYVLATHYHPDHMGLIGNLIEYGIKFLLLDVQKNFIHYSDDIFAKDKLPFVPIDEINAIVISCEESRKFLSGLGILGEIIHTPSHSRDSISLILDNGDCFVGDLEPFEYLEAYEDNTKLKCDWEHVFSFNPKRIFFAHAPEKFLLCKKCV